MTIFKFNQQVTRTFIETGINQSQSSNTNESRSNLSPTTNAPTSVPKFRSLHKYSII